MTFQTLVKLYFGLLKSLEFKTRLLLLPKRGYLGRGISNGWYPVRLHEKSLEAWNSKEQKVPWLVVIHGGSY